MNILYQNLVSIPNPNFTQNPDFVSLSKDLYIYIKRGYCECNFKSFKFKKSAKHEKKNLFSNFHTLY